MLADASSAPPRETDETSERCRGVRKERETVDYEVKRPHHRPRADAPYHGHAREQQNAVLGTGVRG